MSTIGMIFPDTNDELHASRMIQLQQFLSNNFPPGEYNLGFICVNKETNKIYYVSDGGYVFFRMVTELAIAYQNTPKQGKN